ncbi:unnamed protein product [Paramecium pentaurelia]|uniref:Uncharacterized protein n=1 Tax=Paramecium pentaurelia TaxID=43138 RepID=A0A8S1XUU6_9CILI|nr:unnamed protein product [Paramecium pentaurelia]
MGKSITNAQSPTNLILLKFHINLREKQIDLQNQQNQLSVTLDSNDSQNMASYRMFELDDINNPSATLSHTNNDALQHIRYCATLIPFQNLMNFYQMLINHFSMVQIYLYRQKSKRFLSFFYRSQWFNERNKFQKSQIIINSVSEKPSRKLFFQHNFIWQRCKKFSILHKSNQVQEMSADLDGTNILQSIIQGSYDENYFQKQIQSINTEFIFTNRWRGLV